MLFFAILIFLIVSSCKEKEPYILKGIALNTTNDSLYLSTSQYGVRFFTPDNMKVPLGQNGEFKFIIPASTGGFASLFHFKTIRHYDFWIESGVTDSIVIDSEYH